MAFKKRYTSKRRLARAIDEGLKHLQEDHDVFAAKTTTEGIFCGCALAIAMDGLIHLDLDKEDDPDQDVLCIRPIDESLIRQINQLKVDAIAIFAEGCGISYNLASKIDKLHRQDRISAAKIAEMLRSNEV